RKSGDAREAHATAVAAVSEDVAGAAEVRAVLVEATKGRPRSYTENEGWVLVALQNAFFQLLHAPSFEEALVDTVGQGGDTDTNGAIAGALLGAMYGREAIPLRWRSAVLTCRPIALVGARQPPPIPVWPVGAMGLAAAV